MLDRIRERRRLSGSARHALAFDWNEAKATCSWILAAAARSCAAPLVSPSFSLAMAPLL